MTPNYSCVLMDLDGTIFDFKEAERCAILEVLEKAGLSTTQADAQLYSALNDELWKAHERGEIKKEKLVLQRFVNYLQKTGQKGSAPALNRDYVAALSKYAMPFPGAKEFLEELAEFCTIAAITNGSYIVQKKRLAESGLEPYFDEVFISEKMGCVKPAPRFFQVVLDRLGIKNKKRVLVVGDSLSADIKGGINAGLDTCWCNFEGLANESGIEPTYTAVNFEQIKLVAVGEKALQEAAVREKRHTEQPEASE